MLGSMDIGHESNGYASTELTRQGCARPLALSPHGDMLALPELDPVCTEGSVPAAVLGIPCHGESNVHRVGEPDGARPPLAKWRTRMTPGCTGNLAWIARAMMRARSEPDWFMDLTALDTYR